jgi:hypothetical protein
MAVLLGWSADSSPRADTVKVDRGGFEAPRGVGARGLACMEVLGIRRAFHRQRALKARNLLLRDLSAIGGRPRLAILDVRGVE